MIRGRLVSAKNGEVPDLLLKHQLGAWRSENNKTKGGRK